ncbi:MAG: hypothetical protein JXQ75_06775 [Phycisphaerae bacterium]|nr:hypothetical protein [Phycisphaerae bacterium]
MRKHKLLKQAILSASILFAGGTVLSNGCMNVIASTNPCGTVFTFCAPVDWLNLWYPMLETPDYDSDPSCTIPLGCGDGDLLPPLVGGPGGDTPDQPSDDQGGGLGGGGGGV